MIITGSVVMTCGRLLTQSSDSVDRLKNIALAAAAQTTKRSASSDRTLTAVIIKFDSRHEGITKKFRL